MKKLIAALLVLTMVLALTGTVAMADCEFKVGGTAKFIKNATAYKGPHNYNSTSTIVRKGSWAEVTCVKGDWVKLRLVPKTVYTYDADGNVTEIHNDSDDIYGKEIPSAWFKASSLKVTKPTNWEVYIDGELVAISSYHVVFSQGGKDMSKATNVIWNFDNGKCHVKANAKVWMRKVNALQKNYGKALHDGDVVTFRHLLGFDSRMIPFYGIRYKGHNLWVSSEYSELVK